MPAFRATCEGAGGCKSSLQKQGVIIVLIIILDFFGPVKGVGVSPKASQKTLHASVSGYSVRVVPTTGVPGGSLRVS
jgi:hypothetical protein